MIGHSGAPVRAVVFDMGGVLVRLGPLTAILGDDAVAEEDFWPRWLRSEVVRNFEMGRCGPEEFGRHLVAEFDLPFDGEELVRRFAAWPQGLFDGAAELVGSLEVEVAVLSNTNALHWQNQLDADIVRLLFDRRYLSFELGMAKPDLDIFRFVADDLFIDLGAAPSSILFLDDNQVNVDAARTVGMTAHLARGVTDAARVLAEHGFSGGADGPPCRCRIS